MPPGVVTVTSTVPVPAGLSAVIVGVADHREARRRRRAEVDRRGAGEAGAGDRHRGAAGRRTAGRAQARDRRSGDVRELIGGRGGRRPPGVVTVTSTVPVPAGLSAVIVVSLTTVTFVAAVVPKSTAVAPVKLGAGDRHQSAAGGRTAGRAQARDRRSGGVRELIGGRGGRRADRSGHGDVHGAGARRAVGRDRRCC